MHKAVRLENGLSVIVKPVKGTKAATVFAMVPVGSRYENDNIAGASHFVEHLLFKGTRKRPTFLDISKELDAAGAEYNAMTNKDYTCYYIKINSDKISLALDILSDMLFDSKFDADEINRERGVVIEEIKMYEDNPATAVSLNFDRLFFGKHPLGRDIAGSIRSIRKVSRDQLYDYYRSIYRPENMILTVAGGVGRDLMPKIKKYFGRVSSARTGRVIGKNDFAKFSGIIGAKEKLSAVKRKIDQANVIIGFPGLRHSHPDRYALAVLMNIMGGGMSSRLFVEVREKHGLAYRIRIGSEKFRDCGVVYIDTGLDMNRLPLAFKVIRDELNKICRQGVTSKELAGAKTSIAGQLTLSMEDSSAQANWYASKFWFENDLRGYEEELRKIRKVTAAQVRRLAGKIFVMNKMKVAVISPLGQKQIIQSLKK